jgi:glucose/arabinose dehydrogenase
MKTKKKTTAGVLYALLLTCVMLSNSSYAQPEIVLNPVITGLNQPVQVVNAGDGSNRVFIVQKGGSINVYSSSFAFLSTFLTISGISTSGEQGLLSLAFHPQYTTNGFFYVYYTNGSGDLELARYKVSSGNSNVADPASKVIVATIPHPTNTNHNGGELHFGPDGFLYLSTGDGGGGGDVPNNAQNTLSLLGKMLRFNVNMSETAPFYTIPAGNPYGNEIYSLGLRNPFRWSFDRSTGDMWIGDVGQDSWEEINFRPAASTNAANYGWRCYEGNTTYNTSGCGNISNYVFPVHTYATQNPSAAVTGGVVYRGSVYPSLQGYYLAVDFYSGILYKVVSNGAGGWTIATQTLSTTGIADFGETESGEVYAVSLTTGTAYHVEASGPLPVTLTDFKGRALAEGVQLDWKTSAENNVNHFEVEYSYNGNVFGSLATIAAQNRPSGSSYSYVDKNTYAGDVYYRLKTQDRDGQARYSEAIRVDANSIAREQANIYPTLISDGAVYINLPDKSAFKQFEIAGLNGQKLLQISVSGLSGKVNIPLNGLSAGIYLAKLSGKDGAITQKIIVQ